MVQTMNLRKRESNIQSFLFEKENAAQVIDEFGQLILDTFSDEELKTYEKKAFM